MEREALQVQTRIRPADTPIRYMLVAALIWIGVLYGALTPTPTARPERMLIALAPCRP